MPFSSNFGNGSLKFLNATINHSETSNRNLEYVGLVVFLLLLLSFIKKNPYKSFSSCTRCRRTSSAVVATTDHDSTSENGDNYQRVNSNRGGVPQANSDPNDHLSVIPSGSSHDSLDRIEIIFSRDQVAVENEDS